MGGEEVSGPSNETEAEALQRRQVEALERIASLLESVIFFDANDQVYVRTGEKQT